MARVHASLLCQKLGLRPPIEQLMFGRSRTASRLLSDGGEAGVPEKESRYM